MTTMVHLRCYQNPPPAGFDASQVSVYTTLTRYVDPVNNSDKYRRFISVMAPGKLPYVFTHTGRWTGMTAAGNWSGGTYRPGRIISASMWSRSGRTHAKAHAAYVDAKLNDYAVTPVSGAIGGHQLTSITDRWTRYALETLHIDGKPLLAMANGAAPVSPPVQPAPRPDGPPVPQRVSVGSVEARLQSLLARATHEGVDPFDLFEDVATIRRDIAVQRTVIDKWEQDLALANEQIMSRV